MSDPLVRAFFIGRAAADLLFEKVEDALTDVLSEVGKFESDQRERLRTFTDQVLERAAQQEARASEDLGDVVEGVRTGADESEIQATVDEVRAEVAQLRSDLQRYRNQS